jgi:hypothetical protein
MKTTELIPSALFAERTRVSISLNLPRDDQQNG